jgi:hypothetical protein
MTVLKSENNPTSPLVVLSVQAYARAKMISEILKYQLCGSLTPADGGFENKKKRKI